MNTIIRKMIIFFMMLLYIIIPAIGSFACDDCMSLSEGKDADVKHLCPLCVNVTADVNFHDYSPTFETVSLLYEAMSVAFLEPIFPINKPPQR